jgi:hypothetical protein
MEPGIYWVLPSGETLADAPELILPKQTETGGVLSVRRATLLSGLIATDLVRARVESSSGNRQLDLAALSAFRQWVGISGTNLPGGVKPDKDGVLSVAVQWRFATGIELGQPPMESPLWNGEDWRDLHWR